MVENKLGRWHKISGVFEASAAMKYIILGNFCSDVSTLTKHYEKGKRGAYYFLDDVTLRKAEADEKLTPKPVICPGPRPLVQVKKQTTTKENDLTEIKFEAGTTIALSNVFFETGKATLKPESTAELDKLVHTMIDYPNMQIEIRGHTDNVGSDASNQTLSEDRAKAVMNYLLDHKVKSKRLNAAGFGSTKPVAGNDTPEGRQKNRRVEFKIIKR